MKKDQPNRRSRALSIEPWVALLLAALSLAVFREFMELHRPHFDAMVSIPFEVMNGHAYWIAYQNRLLGPGIVMLLSRLGLGPQNGLALFFFLGILSSFLLLYALLRDLGESHGVALGWVGANALLFLVFQDPLWFYPWDALDIVLFTLLGWGACKHKSTPWFCGLFVVGIVHKESALFVPLFLFISAFSLTGARPFIRLLDGRRALAGGALLVLGIAYTKLVRNLMFISDPFGRLDSAHQALGNHVYFWQNVQDLAWRNLAGWEIVNTICLVGSLWVVARAPGRWSERKDLRLVYLALLCSILVFGLINETRMYLTLFALLPFILTTHARGRATG